MDKEKIRIAIYVRKSTYSNFSVEPYEEVAKCKRDATKRYADKQITFVEYIDVHYPEMIKGRLKGINKLVDDIRNGRINVIYTYSICELVGNAVELKAFLDLILKMGIEFVSLDEYPIDTHNAVFTVMRVCVDTIARIETKHEEERRHNADINDSRKIQKGIIRRRALL